jgi:Flp pilus assembly protein TadG
MNPTTSDSVFRKYRLQRRSNLRRHRQGSLLVWCAFLLVILLGMVGLVIDTGLMLAGYRHAQNSSDAACLAAAHASFRGDSVADAVASGTIFVTDAAYNGLTDATVVINIPPSTGPYAGLSTYAEAIVTANNPTHFIHALPGVSQGNTVTARAVAGYELITVAAGVIALDPDAIPGLKISGQATLTVEGAVIVNSEGGGVDENGDPSLLDNNQTATTVNNNGTLSATSVDIVGGVNPNGLDNITNTDPAGPHPLHANQLTTPDPLINMPTPTVLNGVVNVDRGAPQASSGSLALNNPNDDAGSPNYIEVNPVTLEETMILKPGVYESIKITGGKVRFDPGIYVLSPEGNTSFTLEITGGDVLADGIMFYNTGDNYDALTGSPDSSDYLSDQPPPAPDGAELGNVNINASINMSPLDTSLYNYGAVPPEISAFDGMLYYQRRLSDAHVQIQGDSADASLTGTWYAKWGNISIDGQGTYYGTFVVGSLNAEGSATITIIPDLDALPKALQIFLVE